ncbi:MFS transporter [Georgenia alba]|uniref:MFS transporter n=1 Tax=Georgenia alba TaxID=2233858 RepID=A0ABW2Q8E4_9MICO
MPNPYREVLALPGALAFSAAGLLARFAVPMMSIGIVLMLSELTGSYTTAGTVSATYVLSQAAGAPQLSRLVDRYGQARVMRPSLAVSALALVALIIASVGSAPLWTTYACAVIAGVTTGSMGSLVRARWTAVTETPHQLHRAFSLESSLDELTFVIGPVIATALATQVAPWSATAACAGLLVGGGFAFLALRSTEPVPHPRPGPDERTGPRVLSPAVLGLVVVFVFVGGIFGSSEVAVVAFTDELGQAGAAGPLLGVFALGSFLAGLAYGARTWLGPAWRRMLATVTVLGVGAVLFLLVESIVVMGAVMLVTGLSIAPTIINGNTLVQHLVDRRRLTEGLSWLHTGINLGVSAGAALGGALVDTHGSTGGFAVVAVSGGVAVVVALCHSPVLRRADRGSPADLPTAQDA